jgi:ectoine hydroxylase
MGESVMTLIEPQTKAGAAAGPLSEAEVECYRRDGYIVFPGVFNAEEVAALQDELARIFTLDREEHLRAESGEFLGTTVMDRVSPLYARLLRDPRLLSIGRQLLGGPVYCHQYKAIIKQPLGRLCLPWHQDYGPWAHHDGMPRPEALSIGIYLDQVSEFNGPITFIPETHRDGLIPYEVLPVAGTTPIPSLPAETVARFAGEYGMVAPKGPAGTAILFDSCRAHASSPNLSPWPRNLIYVSYNRCDNAITKRTRPSHFSNDDFTPLEPLAGDESLI